MENTKMKKEKKEMTEITDISEWNKLRFSVYEHRLVLADGRLITRKFIVLRNTETNELYFTDWHKYVKSGKNRLSHNVSQDGNKRYNYYR